MTETTTTMIPPSGSAPSVLQLPAEQVFPDSDGNFVVSTKHIGQLMAAGWSIKVDDPTHVP
jgi:hypothetical protein